MTSCTAKALGAALLLATPLVWGGQPDQVLVQMQSGLAAFGQGRVEEASGQFDAALAAIETMFANNENAARARSLWYDEGAKDFKGEPYERVMAYYYRGLLYLAEGDYENARAAFRGGILQDAFAEEEQFRADVASLMMLEGWANQLNGDAAQAADAYAEVRRLRSGWTPPPADANLLVVVELGGAPRKLGDGIGNHEIVYRHAKRMPERQVSLILDGTPLQPFLLEDVYFQATTRGGRPFDSILDGKLKFRNVSGAIGDTLGTVASEGAVISSATGGGNGNVLGRVAAVGAIASIISINVKPKADVRYWNNLPETIHIAAINSSALPQEIAVSLRDEAGNPVTADTPRIQRWMDKKGHGLVWIKTRN